MVEATKPIAPRPPPRPPPVELKPILGGRLWIAIGLLLGLGLIANPLFNNFVIQRVAPPEDIHTNFAEWRENSVGNVRVTVITADSTRGSRALQAAVVDGAHRAFGGDKTAWPPRTPVSRSTTTART